MSEDDDIEGTFGCLGNCDGKFTIDTTGGNKIIIASGWNQTCSAQAPEPEPWFIRLLRWIWSKIRGA